MIAASMRDTKERRELGRVAGRLTLGQGDATMPRTQGMPEGIVEVGGDHSRYLQHKGQRLPAAMFVRPPGRWQHAGREPRPCITVVPRPNSTFATWALPRRRPPS